MAFSCDEQTHGGRGRTPSTPVARGNGQAPVAAGVPFSIPDGAHIEVKPRGGYRAKMFIPCVYGRCPGRMQLHVVDKFNEPLERAFYLCDQNGLGDSKWECPKSHEPTYPEHLNARYVMSAERRKPGRKSDYGITREEAETIL